MASLLAQDGLYARLWAHQSGGFLGEEDEAEVPQPPEIEPIPVEPRRDPALNDHD